MTKGIRKKDAAGTPSAALFFTPKTTESPAKDSLDANVEEHPPHTPQRLYVSCKNPRVGATPERPGTVHREEGEESEMENEELNKEGEEFSKELNKEGEEFSGEDDEIGSEGDEHTNKGDKPEEEKLQEEVVGKAANKERKEPENKEDVAVVHAKPKR
jgi:hypothetical protein